MEGDVEHSSRPEIVFSWRAILTLAVLVFVLCQTSNAETSNRMYIRNHRGIEVYIEPISRISEMVVVKEYYYYKGEDPHENAIWEFDCNNARLRYLDFPSNPDWKPVSEFYDGNYTKAHKEICKNFKGQTRTKN